MADLAQLERALINADAAGDHEAATALTAEIIRQRQSATPTRYKIGREGYQDALREVLRNTDWGTRNIAGAGTAMSDLWHGVKQLVGINDKQGIEDNAVIKDEAPLGAIIGNVAPLAAGAAAIPAINTLKWATALGAGLGALSPVEGQNVAKGKAINTAIGGVSGLAGQGIANAIGARMANRTAQLAAQQAQRAPIDDTIRAAVEAGYIIPPGQVQPTLANRILESTGGKIATQQMASSRNQQVTDRLARAAAGLADDAPITPETLRAARQAIQQPYRDIAGYGLQPELDALDAARAEARNAWREYSRQGTRAALNDYRAATEQAKAIEQNIEQAITTFQRPDLMAAFRKARADLAKNHDVETALIEGGGSVNARAIGRMLQRGDPLSGDLETIGRFANNFPRNVQPPSQMGTPDAHNLKSVLSMAMGGGGLAAAGPAGVAAAAIPWAASLGARGYYLSPSAQRGLIPSYELTRPERLAALLAARNQIPPAAAYGALEALGQ